MFDEKFLSQKLDKFVALLDINAVVEYDFSQEGEEFFVKVFFKGENLGYAIGNRGKNIKAIQYVLSLMLKSILKSEKDLSEEDASKVRVIVDIGDYREQNVKKLKRMVDSKLDDARTLGEYVDLPPMPPADRREIHLYLQNFDDIKTESFGEGRERAVRMIPLSEEDLGLVPEVEEYDSEAEQEE